MHYRIGVYIVEDTKVKKSKIRELLDFDIEKLKNLKNKKNKKQKEVKTKEKKDKIVSFDIDEDYIKIVEGKYYKNELIVYRCAEVKTPANCIDDGKIINKEALVKTLKEALTANRIRAKYASITTNSTQIINREITIPKVEDDELNTVINYEISRYLPINLNDHIVEVLMLGEVEVDGEKKQKVYTICYPEKIARSYFELLEALKLKPYCLDVKFNSLNKIVNYSQEINRLQYHIEDSNIFINIGAVSTDINIYKNGKIDFTRIIKQGYKTLAEYEKNNNNESGADQLIEELERIVQFYKNRVRGTQIRRIYLLGEGSRVENLDKYMSKRLGITVEKVRDIGYIELKNKEKYGDEIYKYLNAIGTIIRL